MLLFSQQHHYKHWDGADAKVQQNNNSLKSRTRPTETKNRCKEYQPVETA